MKNSSTNKRRGGRTLIAAGTAAVTAAAVGGYLLLGGTTSLTGEGGPPSSEGSTLAEETQDDTQHVVLFVDGWSKRTLDATSLRYHTTTQGTTRTEEDKDTRLTLSPVSTADVGALFDQAPEMLEQVAARMVTVDPDLACDTEGCRTPDGDLPAEYFTDAASIPGFGESYAGYGIDSTLYKAEFFLPKDVETVVVTPEGYSNPLTLYVGEGTAVEQGKKEWHLAGAAFGRFFVPESGWQDTDVRSDDFDPYVIVDLDEQPATPEALEASSKDPLLAAGLATPVPAALGMGDQQMTYFTSPTTGCGVAVTCIPDRVEVTFSEPEVQEVVNVCAVEGGAPAYMAFHTRRWTLEYPAPTHQLGVWNGLTPSEFDGAEEGSKALYSGLPPLVSGTQTIRVSEIEILNGPEARLWNLVARIAQEGKDRPEDFEYTYDASTVTEVQDGRFRTC